MEEEKQSGDVRKPFVNSTGAQEKGIRKPTKRGLKRGQWLG